MSLNKGQSSEMAQTINKNATQVTQKKGRKSSPKKKTEAETKDDDELLDDPTSITIK